MTDASRIRQHIRQGGIIAYPTESCYGLGCDPRNFRAVRRLLQLKKRSPAKGLILLAAKPAQLRPYLAALPPALQTRLHAPWPGAHTWLVPAANGCPAWLRGGFDTIAVRVTAHPVAASLCRWLGMALVSTSANPSGGKPARSAQECRRLFGRRVLVVSGRIGVRRRPSTIQHLASGEIIRK